MVKKLTDYCKWATANGKTTIQDLINDVPGDEAIASRRTMLDEMITSIINAKMQHNQQTSAFYRIKGLDADGLDEAGITTMVNKIIKALTVFKKTRGQFRLVFKAITTFPTQIPSTYTGTRKSNNATQIDLIRTLFIDNLNISE